MIGIVCPSPKGYDIAFKLQQSLNANLYLKQNNDFKLGDAAKKAMNECDGIIFISSIGIAVRAISPYIQKKDKDPGVVVVDLSSKYAINILSGHLGGGNELTLKVAEILGAEPIITTATDNMNIIGPDMIAKNYNLVIDNMKMAKEIAVLLVNNKVVGIKDDYNLVKITKGYEKISKVKENSIWITNKIKYEESHKIDENIDYLKVLKLVKQDIVLGIGARRNTPFEKLKQFIEASLIKYNIDIKAVNMIVSVDVKKDEQGIISLAEYLGCPFITFTKEEIKKVQDKYEGSPFVFKTLGITGVCEPSVDLAGAKIIQGKIKHEGMTLAIGQLK
ncbi:MAG: cobalt-precorrin 5A hydrolase [Clostridium butyricum]|nr:cobalt-precorrin 5A hydrolase [Clostridium butyricum]